MRYLIADFVTEFSPQYSLLKELAKPFEYSGERKTDINLSVKTEYIENIYSKMDKQFTIADAENYAYGIAFNRSIVNLHAMFIHSSAITYGGKAYLFSADSGVGKSTHTQLWKKAFGESVEYINDDKPVIRLKDGKAIAYGTPFDGGSKIANNISAPLGAVVFIERAENNSIRKATQNEIIQNLYKQTSHLLNKASAYSMLQNFEWLISSTEFYILKCNTDISSARLAFETIVK